jgi:hypothetical protein
MNLHYFWRSVRPRKTDLQVVWISQNSLGELPIGDESNLTMTTSELSLSTNLEFISVNMNHVAMRISIKHKSELSTYWKQNVRPGTKMKHSIQLPDDIR